MNLFKKSIAVGISFLCVAAMVSSPAEAFWFTKKEDAQACKVKFENKCQAVEEAKNKCSDEFADFYVLADKLKSDLQSLKDSQTVSEKLFKELQTAYESWKQDGFRIDTQSYTDYAILKCKFTDENREIADEQEIVTADMKDMLKFIYFKDAKQNYVSSLDRALEAFYNYSAAAVREAVPTVK